MSALYSTSKDDYFISPRYTAMSWKSLDLTNNDSSDWNEAIKIFYDRIHGRFLAPIESIETNSDPHIKWFSGFSIIALDCLIIETLYQFYHGVDETDINHSKAFWTFFKASPHFAPHFTRKKAHKFYTHFRCGLLHQAQTKEQSKIRVGEPSMVQLIDEKDINKGLIIDRKRFHQALLDEIDDYQKSLRMPKTNLDFCLRGHFVTKMNFIAR